MKKIPIILFLLISFASIAQVQPHTKTFPHGDSTTLDSNKGMLDVRGSVRLRSYATSDPTYFLSFDVNGMGVLRHASGGGGSTDTTSLSDRINAKQAYSDTNTYDATRWYISQNYLPLSGGTINGNLIVTDGAGITIMNANSNDNIYTLGDPSTTSTIHLIGSVDINGDVPLTTIAGIHASGDLTGTYPSPTLAISGVTAATYGSSTAVPRIIIDAKGRITSAVSTTIDAYTQALSDARFAPIAINGTVIKDSAGYGLLGGNVTTSGYKAVDSTLQATRARVQKAVDSLNVVIGTKGSGTVTSVSGTSTRISSTGGATPVIDLVTANATPATSGSGTVIPVITYDAYGRVTTVTTTAPTPAIANVTGLGSGVGTLLAAGSVGTGSVVGTNSPTLTTPNLGTPSAAVGTNFTGTAASLTVGTASTVTTNANLTGPITSTGNATAIASQTGTGTTFVMGASPTLTGTPLSTTAAAGTNTTQIATTAFVLSNTLNQLTAPTADLSINSHKLTNVTTPTATTDAANKAYVDNIAAGINPAVAVQAATTANVPGYTYNNGAAGIGATLTQTAAAIVVVDGYTLLLNDRVLFKNQTTAANNGVYFVATLGTGIIPAVFTRALDYDQSSDINNTGTIPVVNGTINTLTSWLLTSSVTTVGTDALTYSQFSFNPSVVITTSTSAGGDLTGTYPNPTVAASAITNAKVSASAGIAYSKLNLASSIVTGDISATGTPSSTTFYTGNGTWSTPHGYIGTRYFTATGTSTYTPTAGTTRIKVYGAGAGGGSTGSKTGASAAASGGGGGAGGYFEASIGSFTWTSTTITVGVAGIAGLATGANSVAPTGGGNGGNTTFVNGATTITAFGGSGSLYALLGGTVHHSAGGDGGIVSTNGDFNVAGNPGSPGIGENATSAGGGNGGASHYGGSGKGASALNTAGGAATSYGSGGGGSVTGSTNTNNIDGTAGFQGIIIIEEYF